MVMKWKPPALLTFNGVGGTTTSVAGCEIPLQLGSQFLWVQTQIVPGSTPFLLSMRSLQSLRAVLDCAFGCMWTPKQECWIEMDQNKDGHLLIPYATFTEEVLQEYAKMKYHDVVAWQKVPTTKRRLKQRPLEIFSNQSALPLGHRFSCVKPSSRNWTRNAFE